MSQPKKQHSLEEYRQAVKILKLNAMQLVEKNKEIEQKIDAIVARQAAQYASVSTKQVQTAVALTKNRETLAKLKNEKQQKAASSSAQSNQQGVTGIAKKEELLRSLKSILQSKGLNLEMFFRCCDTNYTQEINIEEMKHLLLSRVANENQFSLEDATLIAQTFDEDCSGNISLEEFTRCITLYNLNESPNKLATQRAQEKEVMFRVVKHFDTITKSQSISFATIFDGIANPSTSTSSASSRVPSTSQQSTSVSVAAMHAYLQSHQLQLKDMEMVAFARVLDPLKTGSIDKKAFVREMNAYHKMHYEIDVDREMQSFASLLKQFKVDPIQVFKIADINDRKSVSKTILTKAITKLAPRISAQLLDHFLSVIDVNNNGEIDENEYLIALSQDESNVLFDNDRLSESISSVEKQRILDKMHTYMTKSGITAKELFAKIDRNGNGDISLIELKFSLLDLGFELAQIAQVMKVFDTNSDGKVTFSEFTEILDHAKMLQHGFEKDISEANKNRKNGGSSHVMDSKSQAELTQEIDSLKQQQTKPSKPNKQQQQLDVSEDQPSMTSIHNNIKDQNEEVDEYSNNNQNYEADVDEDAAAAAPAVNEDDEDQYQEQYDEDANNNESAAHVDNNNDEQDEDLEEEPTLKKNKSSLKMDQSMDENRSHTSGSSKKSVKFNIFDEADIQEFILNEEVLDFNKFYEDLGKQRYEDHDFPAAQSSLTTNVKRFAKAKGIEWKNATEVYEDCKVFEGKVEPGDIKQGGLGDCYFLSSLSVLAERENLIKRLFVTKDLNPLGCYSMWMCRDSEWIQFTLDEQIPCEKQGTKEFSPSFSRANGDEMWVLLLEKCYAKMYGTYESIEAGQTIEAIKDLTGAPGKSIKNDEGDINLVWDFIITNERKNFVLTCGSQSDDRGLETKKESGIVSSHAYGILDAQEIKTDKGETVRLIKMRNPWGSMEWQGDWSDNSKKWTPSIRKQLNYFDTADDGIFWMEVKDYVKEFSETSVNYLHDDYYYSWLKLPKFSDKQALVQFVVPMESHAYIMLSQKSDRHFHDKKNYEYSMLKAFLVEINPTSLEPIRYVSDLFSPFREDFMEVTLTQGTYAVIVEIDWLQNIDQTAVVSIYSEQKINLQQHGLLMNPSQGFLDFLCTSIALKDFKKSKSAKINQYEESSDIVQYYEQFGGYVFFMYVNNSSKCTLDEEIELNGTGVELIERPEVYSSPKENSFAITVPPMTTKVVLYKMKADSKGAIQFTIGTSYSISMNESMEDLIEKFSADPDKGDRRDNKGKAVDYYFKVCQYSGGFVLLYQNQTKNLVGKENIMFQNTNLRVKNEEFANSKDKVTFSVKPMDKFAIILEVIDKTSPSGLSYSETGTQFSKA